VVLSADKKRTGGARWRSASCFAAAYFCLEGVSEAEIDLDKVFHRRIKVMIPTRDPVIASLAKESDMGSKPILEPSADVREASIVRNVGRCIIEPVIYPWKARVDGASSRAGEKTAAAAEYVGRQVHTWPEIIQRESQDKVPVITPATALPEADLLRPLLLVIETFEDVRSTAAPWNLRPAYFQGKK
jgi:hypothetical protein